MAYTYSPLASYTVGSGGISAITFTNIPQNYTDLVVLFSGRSAGADAMAQVSFNSNTSNSSSRWVRGNGAATASSTETLLSLGYISYSTDTASTFGSVTFYIPNYTGSTNKSISVDAVSENNGTTAFASMSADLWSNLTAITNITISMTGSSSIAQYSTAYLYGIRVEY